MISRERNAGKYLRPHIESCQVGPSDATRGLRAVSDENRRLRGAITSALLCVTPAIIAVGRSP